MKPTSKPSPERLVAEVDLSWRSKDAVAEAMKSWQREVSVKLAIGRALDEHRAKLQRTRS